MSNDRFRLTRSDCGEKLIKHATHLDIAVVRYADCTSVEYQVKGEVSLDDDQIKRLLECCPRDVRRLVSWLVESGMRLGEALKLRWEDQGEGDISLPMFEPM